jgi:hypothetical protein
MDKWQAQQINEFIRRNPDAREAAERKLLAITSPFGASLKRADAFEHFLSSPDLPQPCAGASLKHVCPHGTQLDLQDCMQCADEAELADLLPHSTLTARLRAGMKP